MVDEHKLPICAKMIESHLAVGLVFSLDPTNC